MSNYQIAKNNIKSILSRQKITYDKTSVSAYELKEAINSEFNQLYDILNTEKNINFINQDRNNSMPKLVKISFDYISKISYHTNNELLSKEYRINFIFSESKNDKLTYESLEIFKENEDDDLGIIFKKNSKKCKITEREKNFIIKNIEFINNAFKVLENISNLKDSTNFSIINSEIRAPWQKKEYEIPYSNILLVFEIEKETKITLKFKQQDLNKIYYAEWLSKPSIEEIVNNNLDEILKRISIPISYLPPIFEDIIKNNQTKNRIKKLKK